MFVVNPVLSVFLRGIDVDRSRKGNDSILHGWMDFSEALVIQRLLNLSKDLSVAVSVLCVAQRCKQASRKG